jgi:hypothetical protein
MQEIINLETFEYFILKNGNSRNLLGYHWVDSPWCDFVLIANNGVDFYKFMPQQVKLSNVKSYQFNVGHYWYEPNDGILVLACSPPKLGQFQTFFLFQNKGTKHFQGPRFQVDISPSVTDCWTSNSPNVSNLALFDNSAKLGEAHSIVVTKIYETSYFLHFNCIKGLLTFYSLSYDKVETQEFVIKVDPGAYEIKVVDNCLLLSNVQIQETYLYDIKSEDYCSKPFCTFWHGFSTSQPKISIKLKPLIERGEVRINSKILYDDKELPTKVRINLTNFFHKVDVEEFLDATYCKVDKDICLDLDKGICYKLVLNNERIVKEHPDRIEAILYLLRRKGCKHEALDYLKDCIDTYIELPALSQLFSAINISYKLTPVLERSRTSREITRRSLPNPDNPPLSRRNTMDVSSLYMVQEYSDEPGVCSIHQLDIFSNVFKPLYEENFLTCNYLISVVLEYIRSLIEYDIPVSQNLQLLLVNLLIQNKDYYQLHQLIQYQIFNDSKDLAFILLRLANPNSATYYAPAFQLGMDMLFRGKAYDEVADTLLDCHQVYEALVFMMSFSCPSLDIKKLLLATEEKEDPELSHIVTQFIKERSL